MKLTHTTLFCILMALSKWSSAAVVAVVHHPDFFYPDEQTTGITYWNYRVGWDHSPGVPRELQDRRMKIDINGDGNHELEFYGAYGGLSVLVSSHAEIMSSRIPPFFSDNSTYVIPVLRGDVVGPDTLDDFQYAGIPPTLWYGSDATETHTLGIGFGDPNNYGGYFPHQQKPPYLALRFMIDGEWHYGWVQITSILDSMGIVSAWAYESEPNTPIMIGVIPEPSFAMLSLCSLALLWRRRKS